MDLGPDPLEFQAEAFIEWIPGTRDALVSDPSRQRLFRVDTQSMTVLAEADVSIEHVTDLVVTGDGARCALIGFDSSSRVVSIVDTAAMMQERRIVVGPLSSYLDFPAPVLGITSDDRRAVVLGPDPADPSQVTLLGYSLSTGSLEASAALPFSMPVSYTHLTLPTTPYV